MNKTPFQTFIDLVALDQNIVALHKECELVSQELMQTSHNKQLLYDHLDNLKKQLQHARKAVDSSELEMKALDEQEKTYKKRLDSVTNLKEYNSVRAELDVLHEEQTDKEQQVINAWNTLDVAQQEYDTYQKGLEDQVRVYDEKLNAYKLKHAECMQQIDEQKNLRPSREQGVPAEWLEKYMVMRERVSDPVVALRDEICSACFHNATKQDALTIQRGALIQCKGCYRLLYAPERLSDE